MDRSFLKHAATYGLGTLLNQAGGFILLPLFLRYLGPTDYGVMEVVGRLAETVAALLLFGGLRQALMTFYQQAPDEVTRCQVVASTLFLLVSTSLFGGMLAFAFSSRLGVYLAPDPSGTGSVLAPGLIQLAILGILLEPLIVVPLALYQARVESLRYVAVGVGLLITRLALTVLFVQVFDWGVGGALGANTTTVAIFGLGLTIRELSRGMAWPDPRQFLALLSFALPMLPGGLCFFVLRHGDRFFLIRSASVAEVGIYSLGYKLALVVALFSLNPLYMVWSSSMYSVAKREDGAIVFGVVTTRILAAFLFVGLGLCLFAPEAVLILGGERYLGAVAIVPPVVLACFFQSASSLMDAGLYVKRRTGLKLGVTLFTTVVMLVLYAALIPIYGGMGAALATLGGFAFLALATFLVSQRVFPVRYPWARLTGLVGLAIILWFVGYLLPVTPWAMVLKAGLWLSAPVLSWLVGLAGVEDKESVRDIGYRVLAWLRRSPVLAAQR